MEKNNKKIGKNDLILVVLVVAVAAIIFVFYTIGSKNEAASITVRVDGEIQGVYSLLEDQMIEINQGTNILQIKDGEADMIEADCPDKLCVKQKEISKNKESIICLPNKVIVEVESTEDSEYDAVIN